MTGASIVTPEDRLVLLLAHGRLSPRLVEQAHSLLSLPLCWDRVLAQVQVHDVYPLVHRNLSVFRPPGIPAEIQAELDALARMNGFRNAVLAEELSRALRLMSAAGIPVAPLKGVTLAESLYGDPSLRVCADLDVLVPRAAVARAFALLLDNGYGHDEEPLCKQDDVDLLLDSNIEYAFVASKRELRCRLELHWDLVWRWPGAGAATDDLWREAQSARFFGSPGYALSPEWQLLFLATHLTRHRWQGLKWLIDIHELCAAGTIDWRKVGAKAAWLGWDDMLALTLGACRALLDTPVPAGVPLRAPPSWLTRFPVDPASTSILDDALLPLRVLGRTSHKLRYLVRLVFAPTLTERRALTLPHWLDVLYYLIRPARLIQKWGGALIRSGIRRS